MKRRLALAASLAALAFAGCGDDEEEAGDPASVAPAASLIYADAVLRPEGEDRTAIETPLAALLDSEDPGALIVEQLDRALAEGNRGATYEADIEPWLGERGAVFFTSIYPPAASDVAGDGSAFGADVDGAFAVEVTDPDAARSFADEASDEGDAYEIVGDFLVAGSEEGVEAAVDAESDGAVLAEDADFDGFLGADADAAARLYVDVPAIVASAEEAGELSESDRSALDGVLGGIADEPLTAVVDARTTGFGLEVSTGATDLPLLSAAGESTLLRDLPGDTWLAAGLPGAGDAIGAFLASAGDLGVPAGRIEAGRDDFKRETGLDLAEAYDPLGDGALFANGEGIFGTGGGFVFETDDPAGARKLIAGFERALERSGERRLRPLSGEAGESGFSAPLPGAPGSVNFVAGRDRIVIAYGDSATAAVLDPGAAERVLGESATFTEAESVLGDEFEVTGYFDFGPLVGLLDLAAATDPALQRALPYLESLDFLITGSSADGERERHRLFLGIADIVAEPSA